MKSIDIFCASPASTAICSSTDHRAIIRHGMRSVDRHQTHRLGERPRARTNAAPCSSHLPLEPSRKKHQEILRRKSSADAYDLAASRDSSRYLLSDKPFLDFVPDSRAAARPPAGDASCDKRLSVDAFPVVRSLSTRAHESPVFELSKTDSNVNGGKLIDHLNAQKTSLTLLNRHQVVELRVSIHCKGCEGKLRKHISRMEGVTSFSIDLETKKVTVIGNVTPVGVLTSISKVKNAQFWPSPTSSRVGLMSPSPRVGLTR